MSSRITLTLGLALLILPAFTLLILSGLQTNYEALTIVELRQLTEQGDAEAQFNLGYRYEVGDGVPQDFQKALEWYLVSADQGHAGAQYFLGNMYAAGTGVAKDKIQALKWLDLASSDRSVRALAIRLADDLAQLMTPEDVSKAKRLAIEWKPNK